METLIIVFAIFMFGYALGYRRGRGNVARAAESLATDLLGRRR